MASDLHIPGICCDACGKTLLIDEAVRYVVDIRVYAAYDPMEITRTDYEKDRREEIRKVLDQCRKMSPQELEDQIYREYRFHLCPGCQKEYLQDPLRGGATSGQATIGEGTEQSTGDSASEG